ncbi:hypothetical protein TWF506_002526 [Arthrobotrys conoides]|uniref:Uncharacterized protein n=1 Tax=Arthrobotrys conoides TaxID=74498 RepID=A0AAN8RRI9_9PEZI
MSTNLLASEKFCPELAPHADVYAASHVVALAEPLPAETPSEYQSSRESAPMLQRINAVAPFLQLFKMNSLDAVALNVYILGNKTVVTVAHNPNVTGESFTEAADAFKQYVAKLNQTLASPAQMDTKDNNKQTREEACSHLLKTVVCGCRGRIVECIRGIQGLLPCTPGPATNTTKAPTTFEFESALPLAPMFMVDDLSIHECACFASLIRSHTGFCKRVDNDGEFVQAWLDGCLRRLIDFGKKSNATPTETESTRELGQSLGGMALDDLPKKGKENQQGLCMEANLSQQGSVDSTTE